MLVNRTEECAKMTAADQHQVSGHGWASFGQLSVAEQVLIDAACNSFESSWQSGSQPDLASYLQDAAAKNLNATLFQELLRIELAARRARGEQPAATDYSARFPQFEAVLANCFAETSVIDAGVTQTWNARLTAGRSAGVKPQATTFPIAFGEYELLSELGRGGMGVVYKARQTKLNRFVALKLTRPDANWDERAMRYFQNEAEAVARLDHPGIVPLYDIGEVEGQLYFTMALVDGPSLRELIRKTPLPAETAAYLLKEVAEAVHAAHERGVVHRDLKPHNILLEGGRRPRVVDFGLAQKLETASDQTLGLIVGSPSYMSPEQATGKTAEIGPRSDVYSLGATLYEAVCGRPPFQAATIGDTLRQVLDTEPISPRQVNPAVPRDLETILLKCLRKHSAGRYPTALALAEDLDRFLNGHAVLARPISRIERAWRWSRRNRLSAALLAICVVTLIVGFCVSLTFALQSQAALARLTVEQAASAKNFDTALNFVDAHAHNSPEAVTPAALELMESAQKEYRQRVERDPLDLKSWDALARFTGRAAEGYRQLGRDEQAHAAAKACIAATRKKLALTNSDADRHVLANRLEYHDAITDTSGNGAELLAIRKQLTEADRDAEGLAYSLYLMAFNKSLKQPPQEALATISQGLVHAETAREASPDGDLAWRRIENGYAHQAQLLVEIGKVAEAEQVLNASVGRLKKFIASHPDCIQARLALAEAYNRIVLYIPGDKLPFAQAAHLVRSEVMELRLKEPAWSETVKGLRDADYNLGEELLAAGRLSEARDVLLTAERLLKLEGSDLTVEVRARLTYTLNLLSQAEAGQGNFQSAAAHAHQALAHLEKLTTAAPENPQFAYELVALRYELGKLEEKLENHPAAIEHLLQAAAGFRDLSPRAETLSSLGGYGKPVCLYYSAGVYARAHGYVIAHEKKLPASFTSRREELRSKAISGLRTAIQEGFDDRAAKAASLEGVQFILADDDWNSLSNDPELLELIKPVPDKPPAPGDAKK